MKKVLTLLTVIGGALLATALSIDAFDTYTGASGTLLASLSSAPVSCPPDMVLVSTETQNFCIDTFEAAVGEDCPSMVPKSVYDTVRNVAAANCKPISQKGVEPWRHVSYTQALQLCARAGKFLPSPTLWYTAALGTPDNDTSCAQSGELELTGKNGACKSGAGAYDMIGNVWEIVAATPDDLAFATTSGYVDLVDGFGIPTKTTQTPNLHYFEDYLWRNEQGTVNLRGGFYGAGSDGGLYSLQVGLSADFSSAAIGFRCARSL